MSEDTNTPDPDSTSNRTFNVIVAIAVAVIALAGSFITKIQSDASSLSSAAGNDEQMYYYRAMGEQISGDANTNYEFGTIYQLWVEYNLLATSAEKNGDLAAANSYRNLRDNLLNNSSLLTSDYFDSTTGNIDLLAYKTNLYQLNVIQLLEMQSAASDVADAWDEKDSAYVLQLTLLAVASFLLGLALMTKSKIARTVFVASGIPMVVIISIWAYIVWKQPVYDLRETGAIQHFANGVNLTEQKHWTEALEQFNRAIDLAGEDQPYGHAYIHRAQANAKLGKFEAAVNDYLLAIDMGENDPNVVGNLVWALFQTGKFPQAIEVGQTALEENPDNLWLQLRVGMALLANGDQETAKQQYQNIVELASDKASNMRSLGDDPSEIWWQLNDASFQLEKLVQLLKKSKAVSPVKSSIKDKQLVIQSAQDFISLLNEASVSLQYEIVKSEVKTVVNSPEFALATTSDQVYVHKVDVVFQYSGLEKGQLLAIKVLRNGIEDPSWTYTKIWDQNSQGKITIILTPAYADVYIVPPGTYEVHIYVNGKLIQSGGFLVNGSDSSTTAEIDSNFVFSDMLNSFNFFNMDIFADTGDLVEEDLYFDPTQFYETGQEIDIDTLNNDEETAPENNDTFTTCEDPNSPECASQDATNGDTTEDTANDNITEDTTNGDSTSDNADTGGEDAGGDTGGENSDGGDAGGDTGGENSDGGDAGGNSDPVEDPGSAEPVEDPGNVDPVEDPGQ